MIINLIRLSSNSHKEKINLNLKKTIQKICILKRSLRRVYKTREYILLIICTKSKIFVVSIFFSLLESISTLKEKKDEIDTLVLKQFIDWDLHFGLRCSFIQSIIIKIKFKFHLFSKKQQQKSFHLLLVRLTHIELIKLYIEQMDTLIILNKILFSCRNHEMIKLYKNENKQRSKIQQNETKQNQNEKNLN